MFAPSSLRNFGDTLMIIRHPIICFQESLMNDYVSLLLLVANLVCMIIFVMVTYRFILNLVASN